MSFRYKKQGQLIEVSLEKMMVAVKTLKGILLYGRYYYDGLHYRL